MATREETHSQTGHTREAWLASQHGTEAEDLRNAMTQRPPIGCVSAAARPQEPCTSFGLLTLCQKHAVARNFRSLQSCVGSDNIDLAQAAADRVATKASGATAAMSWRS